MRNGMCVFCVIKPVIVRGKVSCCKENIKYKSNQTCTNQCSFNITVKML